MQAILDFSISLLMALNLESLQCTLFHVSILHFLMENGMFSYLMIQKLDEEG